MNNIGKKVTNTNPGYIWAPYIPMETAPILVNCNEFYSKVSINSRYYITILINEKIENRKRRIEKLRE